ncbi:MAG: MFS transporter [Gammaproteobacteria bacterium]|jgi:MFS family permease
MSILSKHQSPSEFKRWLVVMTATVLFFYTFIQMNMLNPIGMELMRVFDINARQFGTLSSMYFYGNFILLFPAGLLLDRFSVKKILLCALILATAGMFVFAFSNSYAIASISRFAYGIAGSFGFLSAIRLASRWFPPKKLALVSGCIVTFAMLGGVVAQAPMELLTEAFGWRNALIVFGVLGIVLICLVFVIVRDYPGDYKVVGTKVKDIAELGFWRSVRMVVFNRYNWIGGLYTTLMNLPVFTLGALWGSMYLTQVNMLSTTHAAEVDSMIFLGTLVGSPLIGWISDKIKLRVAPMFVGAVLSLAIIFVIMYSLHLSFGILMVLFFLLGLITATQVIGYPVVAELNSPLVTGSAISIVSLLIMASGFICQPLFGWFMDLHWNHLLVYGMRIYSLHDFRTALWMIPIGFIVSIALSLLIKETHGQFVYKD